MKLFNIFAFILFAVSVLAQSSIDYSVQTWAEIDASSQKITVHWKPVNNANNYLVYKKMKTGDSWGGPIANLADSITFYEDSNIVIGKSYEYQIRKTGSTVAYGYINAGIELPPVHYRGKILLLVDSLFTEDLSVEISQLIEDFIGDGWEVIRHDINRDSSVTYVKQIIVSEYKDSPSHLDALFCLGHIPVPYSGNLNPDGHGNHKGAWPADGYYGDINGTWTDYYVNNTTASNDRNHNIPGDGKFDQSYFASKLELQVGRVDFNNMPAFFISEKELLRKYLIKDHKYKTGEIKAKMRAVIDDNFGGFGGEAFAGSAWKSFAPMLHPDNVKKGDYRTSMDTSSYIWSYGCGGGSYTSCSGIGKTSDIAGDSLQGIFTCLFGSYFGDWDSKNNILRAPLAQGTILTNCWSGRPHWYFHHMAMGENIGYSTKLNMNNKGVFYNSPLSFLGGIVSMGLMGDPTLRLHVISPAKDLTASFSGSDVELSWSPSSDPVLGYYIYRSDEYNGHYTLLNNTPVDSTTYTDKCIEESGKYFYMVRATLLQNSPSGSYYNLSQGVFTDIQTEVLVPEASFSVDIDTNKIVVTNTSLNADKWEWSFGDDSTSVEFEPVHFYKYPGDYNITLIVYNDCFSDTLVVPISLEFTKTNDLLVGGNIYIYPNPVKNSFVVKLNNISSEYRINVFDAYGKKINMFRSDANILMKRISLKGLPSGVYFVQVVAKSRSKIIKIFKE
jgi:hypothetical protein